MNSITMSNRLSIVIEEATSYIKDGSEVFIHYHPTVDEYLNNAYDEYEIEEIKAFYENNDRVVNGFVIVDGVGWTDDESIVIPEEDISTHESIINEIDAQYLKTDNRDNRFLYVSQSRLDEFKTFINQYFTGVKCTKSPYSSSYYNSDEISWGNKPDGSVRLADHWNFETIRIEYIDDEDIEVKQTHCVTVTPDLKNETAIGVYNKSSSEYTIVFHDNAIVNPIPVEVTDSGIIIHEK